MPSPRAMTAAWLERPPRIVKIPAEWIIARTSSGAVSRRTRMTASPRLLRSSASSRLKTSEPDAAPGLAGSPWPSWASALSSAALRRGCSRLSTSSIGRLNRASFSLFTPQDTRSAASATTAEALRGAGSILSSAQRLGPTATSKARTSPKACSRRSAASASWVSISSCSALSWGRIASRFADSPLTCGLLERKRRPMRPAAPLSGSREVRRARRLLSGASRGIIAVSSSPASGAWARKTCAASQTWSRGAEGARRPA